MWHISHVSECRHVTMCMWHDSCHIRMSHDYVCVYIWCDASHTFLDGYYSTVQGLLDCFEVDLGFTELLFIQIDLCVMWRMSHMNEYSFMCNGCSCVTHVIFIHVWCMSHMNEHSFMCNRDYILQKRPIFLCVCVMWRMSHMNECHHDYVYVASSHDSYVTLLCVCDNV